MGRSSNGQPDLVRVSSRQCRCTATCWNAAPHIPAFESPTRATVVAEAVSPSTHSGCPTSKKLPKQPLEAASGAWTARRRQAAGRGSMGRP